MMELRNSDNNRVLSSFSVDVSQWGNRIRPGEALTERLSIKSTSNKFTGDLLKVSVVASKMADFEFEKVR